MSQCNIYKHFLSFLYMIFSNQTIIEQVYLCFFIIVLRLYLIDIGLNNVVLSCLPNQCIGGSFGVLPGRALSNLVWSVCVYMYYQCHHPNSKYPPSIVFCGDHLCKFVVNNKPLSLSFLILSIFCVRTIQAILIHEEIKHCCGHRHTEHQAVLLPMILTLSLLTCNVHFFLGFPWRIYFLVHTVVQIGSQHASRSCMRLSSYVP